MNSTYKLKSFWAVFCAAWIFAAASAAETASGLSSNSSWSDDFSQPQKSGIPQAWKTEGSKFGVPATDCKIKKLEDGTTVLAIKCDKSTGGIIIAPPVNLKKTPIMRWRWRILSYPKGADGRNPKKDDQPIGIYIGTNDGLFKKKSVAYRWEDLTPKGFEGTTSYAGILTVHYITMRDSKTKPGEWITESRNVAEDFKRVYGKVPAKFAVSVIGNSQYTQSNTVAELDFIEFIPAK